MKIIFLLFKYRKVQSVNIKEEKSVLKLFDVSNQNFVDNNTVIYQIYIIYIYLNSYQKIRNKGDFKHNFNIFRVLYHTENILEKKFKEVIYQD